MTLFVAQPLSDGLIIACDTIEHVLNRDGNFNNPHKTGKIIQITPSIIAVLGGVSDVGKIVCNKIRAEFPSYSSVDDIKTGLLLHLSETWSKFEDHYKDYTGDRDYLHSMIVIGGIYNYQTVCFVAACDWGAKPVARMCINRVVYPPVDHLENRIHQQLDQIDISVSTESIFSPSIWEFICLVRDSILEISKTEPLIGGDFHFGIVRAGFETQFGEYQYDTESGPAV